MWLEEFMEGLNAIWITYIILGFIGWGALAASCAWLAGQKGRDKITWGCVGLILGALALILLAITPSKKISEE